MTRPEILAIRLTARERALIETAARLVEETPSTWARRVLLRELPESLNALETAQREADDAH